MAQRDCRRRLGHGGAGGDDAAQAVARRPGKAEDNVAAISLFGFTAFMFAPPIIGFLADWIGLKYALFLIAPFAATSYLLSAELEKGGEAQ